MRSRLFWKLFALQLGAAIGLVACSLLALRLNSTLHLGAFVDDEQKERLEEMAERLSEAYRVYGDLRRAASDVLRQPQPEGMPPHHPPPGSTIDARLPNQIAANGSFPAPEFPPAREGQRMGLSRNGGPVPGAIPETGRPFRSRPPLQIQNAEERYVAGDPRPVPATDAWRQAIVIDGRTVGYIVQPARGGRLSAAEDRFLKAQEDDLRYAAAIAIVLAIVTSAVISAWVLKPVRAVSSAASALARRDFLTRLPASGNDELARLASDFNELASTLEAFERQRRQWLADIAHELRTPLAVLRGELEALSDGVRTADASIWTSLNQEVMRMVAMVEDLHLLSLAESGGLRIDAQTLPVEELLAAVIERFETRFSLRGFELQVRLPEVAMFVHADQQRLEQVLANLLENTLRYARPPGPVELVASAAGSKVSITVSDGGPGVPDEALPKLFDRLYRLDKNRSRATGGSGLGLAICRSLVEAQQGSIQVEKNARGGLDFIIEMPLEAQRQAT